MSASEADELFLALTDSPSSSKNTFMKMMADYFGFEYTPIASVEGQSTEVKKQEKGLYPLNPFSGLVGGKYNDEYTSKTDYVKGFNAVVNHEGMMAEVMKYYHLGQKIYAIKAMRAFLVTKHKPASGLYCTKCMCEVLFEAWDKIKQQGGKITNYEYKVDSILLTAA